VIRIDPTLNELEVLVVADQLEKAGIKSYDLLPGNRCIWATYYKGSSSLNEYYIFQDGLLVDVQID
jgi:hypothetical protein